MSSSEVEEYIKEVKKSNEIYETKIENIRLKNIIKSLNKENIKIPKAKKLLIEYKSALEEKEQEIERLKKNINLLHFNIKKMPKIFRKYFFKELEFNMLQ